MKKIFLLLMVFFIICAHAKSSPDTLKTCQAIKLIGPGPEIDGYLTDEAWEFSDWCGGFKQYEPYEKAEPSQQTVFKVAYDNDNIYVAIKGFDSEPSKIVRRLSRRDDFEGDMMGIHFDSYNDKLTAFMFWVSAAGVKVDGIITNGGENEDISWDAVWFAKTSIDDKGWYVEMKIPFSQLRFTNSDVQSWGMQVQRFLHRKEEMDMWQFIPKDAPSHVANYGKLTGITGIKPRRQIEIQPYSVIKTESYQVEDGNPFQTGKNTAFSAGIDGKIGLTNNLILDFTVNPDFGQVEADPSEVNLSAFESYFEEKRPFFIEGKSILSFPVTPGDNGSSSDNLFYSRRIGRSPHYNPDADYADMPVNTSILGAFKVTGKSSGGWSVGILESLTGREFADHQTGDIKQRTEVEPLTNYFVSRLQKDFDEGKTRLGTMFTATHRSLQSPELDYLHKSAYSGGIDFQHSWKNRTYYFNAKVLFSEVNGSTEAIINTQESSARYFQRPDADYTNLDSSRTSLRGHGGILQFGKDGDGHWRYTTWVNWRSPGLELNDVGFLRRADDIFQVVWVGYRYWKPFSIFREININWNQWSGWDFGFENTYKGGNMNVNTQFKNFWALSFGINIEGNEKDNTILRGGPAFLSPGGMNQWIWIGTDAKKKLVFRLQGQHYQGRQDYASRNLLGGTILYRPTDALNISVNPSVTMRKSLMQYIDEFQYGNNARYVFGSIDQKTFAMAFRINYSVTPDLSFQYYGQPFISAGTYSDFKYVTNPRAPALSDRYQSYTDGQWTYDASGELYNIDENKDDINDYSFDKPDFNAFFFISNLVVRWEYLPGSSVYLVWSQNRAEYTSEGRFSFGDGMNDLFDIFPHNVFLIKLSYRFRM
ncbi:MAG: DUF5916 domain-containing protein [Bacteroidales bacterium]|nr:DUF5916 domain-containing protein [Bacteroidales bacterium]